MKYGFVYIWFDRKHKRYYIGCHWGTTDDSYICSSTWMRDSYRRRPLDFKRRILVNNIPDRKQMFEEEYKWLRLIKQEELGKRYYNLKIFALDHHWAADPTAKLTVSQKLSKSLTGRTTYQKGMTMEQIHGPEKAAEIKKKFRLAKLGKVPHNKGKTLEERYGIQKAAEIREKNRNAHIGKPGSATTFKKGHIPWNAKYSKEMDINK